MSFADRFDAGRRLAAILERYRKDDPIILALPRGGVPVAAEIAAALDAPLDLLLVRKIGVPGHEELAAGAIVDDPQPIVVRNEGVIAQAQISQAAFDRVRLAETAELRRRRQHYLGDRPLLDVADRTVIVVDDGVATGATMRAALRALRRRHPRRLVLAVPVGQTETIAELGAEADIVECLEVHEVFGAIGNFYGDFRQLSDDEVISTLARFSPSDAPPSSAGA